VPAFRRTHTHPRARHPGPDCCNSLVAFVFGPSKRIGGVMKVLISSHHADSCRKSAVFSAPRRRTSPRVELHVLGRVRRADGAGQHRWEVPSRIPPTRTRGGARRCRSRSTRMPTAAAGLGHETQPHALPQERPIHKGGSNSVRKSRLALSRAGHLKAARIRRSAPKKWIASNRARPWTNRRASVARTRPWN